MDTIDKIFRWIESRRMKDIEFSEQTGIRKNNVSRVRSRTKTLSFAEFVRAYRAMGVSGDWLLDDDDQRWPPPTRGGDSEILTDAERRILELARLVSEDAELTEARDRLIKKDRTPIPARPAVDSPPGDATDRTPEDPPRPGRRKKKDRA